MVLCLIIGCGNKMGKMPPTAEKVSFFVFHVLLSTMRKWRDREESSGRWSGYVMPTKVIFRRAEVSFFWRKSVFREVRMQPCLALRFLVTLRLPVQYIAVHEIFAFLSNIKPCGPLRRQTSGRTKTSARLKITFVDMTYLKGLTGSLPLCPLIFSCANQGAWVHGRVSCRAKNKVDLRSAKRT